MPLDEDVDHIPILVDSPPEIVPLALDVHEELVQVPDVSLTTSPTPQVLCVVESELLTPLTYGLMGDDDSPFCQELLNISEAQTESMVQPHRVTDDLGRKPVSVVTAHFAFHQRSLGGNRLKLTIRVCHQRDGRSFYGPMPDSMEQTAE
jgi:hypothetical protein